MTTPIVVYSPVWPDIAPWAVRLFATLDASLVLPPAPKDTWATEEVRKLEIQRLLSADFSVVPTYEVPLDKRHITLLDRAIDDEYRHLNRADNLERYQASLRRYVKLNIGVAMGDKQLWAKHGWILRKVRTLTELCYMEVFRRLPEHRRLAASTRSNDPIKLLVVEAMAEDQAKRRGRTKRPESGVEHVFRWRRTRISSGLGN